MPGQVSVPSLGAGPCRPLPRGGGVNLRVARSEVGSWWGPGRSAGGTLGAGQGEKGSVVPGGETDASVGPEGARRVEPTPRMPPRVPRPARRPAPGPRRYSRALGALRAHDEAELVDSALREAVGL